MGDRTIDRLLRDAVDWADAIETPLGASVVLRDLVAEVERLDAEIKRLREEFDLLLLAAQVMDEEAERQAAIIRRVRDLCAERNAWLDETSPLHALTVGDVRVALITVPEILAALDGETNG
jgi:hypothetical protein